MCSSIPLPSFGVSKGNGRLCDPLESKIRCCCYSALNGGSSGHRRNAHPDSHFLESCSTLPCATKFTEDVLVRSMPDPTFGCVNEHESMMLVCAVVKFYIILDKLTAICLLVIWLFAHSILISTTNDPLDNVVFWPAAFVLMMMQCVGDIR